MSVAPTSAGGSLGEPVLHEATSEAEVDAVRALFGEYAASLAADLCIQGFSAELRLLPGAYARPRGALLLATVDGQAAGCAALRPAPGNLAPVACEMKRLYVRPPFRSLGLGRRLVLALVERAKAAGYGEMLLDTLDDMVAARSLYASLGFEPIAAYDDNPIVGAHHLRLRW